MRSLRPRRLGAGGATLSEVVERCASDALLVREESREQEAVVVERLCVFAREVHCSSSWWLRDLRGTPRFRHCKEWEASLTHFEIEPSLESLKLEMRVLVVWLLLCCMCPLMHSGEAKMRSMMAQTEASQSCCHSPS